MSLFFTFNISFTLGQSTEYNLEEGDRFEFRVIHLEENMELDIPIDFGDLKEGFTMTIEITNIAFTGGLGYVIDWELVSGSAGWGSDDLTNTFAPSGTGYIWSNPQTKAPVKLAAISGTTFLLAIPTPTSNYIKNLNIQKLYENGSDYIATSERGYYLVYEYNSNGFLTSYRWIEDTWDIDDTDEEDTLLWVSVSRDIETRQMVVLIGIIVVVVIVVIVIVVLLLTGYIGGKKVRKSRAKKRVADMSNVPDLIRKFIFTQFQEIEKNIQGVKSRDVEKYIEEVLRKKISLFYNALTSLDVEIKTKYDREQIFSLVYDESQALRNDLTNLLARREEEESLLLERERARRKIEEQRRLTTEAFGEELVDIELVEKTEAMVSLDAEIDNLLKTYEDWEYSGEAKKGKKD